jgi:hypothetical protein
LSFVPFIQLVQPRLEEAQQAQEDVDAVKGDVQHLVGHDIVEVVHHADELAHRRPALVHLQEPRRLIAGLHSLPAGVRLVTWWTILAVIKKPCFDCKIAW